MFRVETNRSPNESPNDRPSVKSDGRLAKAHSASHLRRSRRVANALLLGQSLPAYIGHNFDEIGERTVL
jgi:hypothetical protein